MTTQLTLRLREDDVRAFNEAARIIAGPAGAPFIGRTAVMRRALKAFNEANGDAAKAGKQAA